MSTLLFTKETGPIICFVIFFILSILSPLIAKLLTWVFKKIDKLRGPIVGENFVIHRSLKSIPNGTYDILYLPFAKYNNNHAGLLPQNPTTSWLTHMVHEIHISDLPKSASGEIVKTITISN